MKDMYKVGKEATTFKIEFREKWYDKNDILASSNKDTQLLVVRRPRRIWYKFIWELLTFGMYQADWVFKVKEIKDDSSKM